MDLVRQSKSVTQGYNELGKWTSKCHSSIRDRPDRLGLQEGCTLCGWPDKNCRLFYENVVKCSGGQQ